MSKKSFILYTEIKDVFEKLTREQVGNVMMALLEWQETGSAGGVDPITDLVITPIIAQFKRDSDKWEIIRLKRSEAGKLGGRGNKSKANKANALSTKQKKAKALFDKQTKANKAVNVDVDGNVDVIHSTNAASADAVVEEVWLSAKKRKLKGKRLEAFKLFWKAFGYTKGRAGAIDSWLNIPELTDPLVAEICRSAELEAVERPSILAQGKSPKFAQGWITDRRWEDEPIAPVAPINGFDADGRKKAVIDMAEVWRDKNVGYDENGRKIKENVG
jgi:hypothetical protein